MYVIRKGQAQLKLMSLMIDAERKLYRGQRLLDIEEENESNNFSFYIERRTYDSPNNKTGHILLTSTVIL